LYTLSYKLSTTTLVKIIKRARGLSHVVWVKVGPKPLTQRRFSWLFLAVIYSLTKVFSFVLHVFSIDR
jgi:hypothetical protein